MYKVTHYKEKFDDEIRRLDAEMADEMKAGDTLPDSRYIVLYNKSKVAAAGYLLYGPEDQTRYFVHLNFKATDDEEGVVAADMLLNALIARFQTEAFENPRRKTVLRTWASDVNTEYIAFLQNYGFSRSAKMFCMASEKVGVLPVAYSERFLNGVYKESEDVRYVFEQLHIENDTELYREYFRVNGESFGIPDTEGGMKYKLETLHARLFGIVRYDERKRERELVSCMTTWDESPEVATTEDVFTGKKYRRRGFMTELFREVFSVLHKEGKKQTILNVYGNNLTALRLYERFGYKKNKTLIEMQK